MGGRVVEGTGLENRQAGDRLVGSNPTPSATISLTTNSLRSLPPRGRPFGRPRSRAPVVEFEPRPELSAIRPLFYRHL